MRESEITNLRYTVGDGDAGKFGAIFESTLSNLRYTVGDGDALEAGAILESTMFNLRCPFGNDGNPILDFIISHNNMFV
jgi:hypothetical protein